MIGKDYYITSSKPSDFFSDHAEGAYRKLLVNVNEAESKDGKSRKINYYF